MNTLVEQPLTKLLQETTQAHFLQTLALQEALIVLQERREHLHNLLQLSNGQEQHPCSALLLDHVQMMLAGELAWTERAITALRAKEWRPCNKNMECTRNAKSSG
ncbi:MAG TPA: hypothetical protein VHZ51_00550 [Ktedonobacteraceae bacterium]|jgi:hypothetical protein|nr:hypothetical protein [Ktedonobacteraceae bacterium]